MGNDKDNNIIKSVSLKLCYDETISSKEHTLIDAEEHFYKYMYPSIQEVLEHYSLLNLYIEQISIDLGNITINDIPSKLKELLTNAIEKFINDKANGDAPPNTRLTESSLLEDLYGFICLEKTPWEKEFENFDPMRWWNKNAADIFSNEQYSRSILDKSLNDPSIFYRLLQYSNTNSLNLILNSWYHIIISDAAHSSNEDEHDSIPQHMESLFNLQKTSQSAITNALLSLLLNKGATPHIIFAELSDIILNSQTHSTFSCEQIQNALLTHSILQQNRRTLLHNSCESDQFHTQEVNPLYDKPDSNSNELDQYNKNSHKERILKQSRDNIKKHNSLSSNIPIKEQQTPVTNFNSDSIFKEIQTEETTNFYQRDNLPLSQQPIETTTYYSGNSLPLSHMDRPGHNNVTEIIDSIFPQRHSIQEYPNLHFYTDNAGLVLLHPFLSIFFKRTNLIDEKKHFISFEKQIHAVHLLRFASGKTGKHFSHLLCLEKILCGFSPNFPIPTEFSISEQEQHETKDLYLAISQHWKSVKNTSIDGIQNSFVHRTGIISMEAPYWLVRVENSAIDILMDDIPWELSTIILPWNDKSIWVEWQNENN